MDVVTKTVDQTHAIATKVLSQLDSNVIAFTGDLGSGKTAFTQGLGKALGVEKSITSPTFLLLKPYNTQSEKYKKLIHLDLYRVGGWGEISELALQELWENKSNLVVIEWAERIKEHLPTDTTWITFEYVSEGERKIVFESMTD